MSKGTRGEKIDVITGDPSTVEINNGPSFSMVLRC
jgi:hypothetical protein